MSEFLEGRRFNRGLKLAAAAGVLAGAAAVTGIFEIDEGIKPKPTEIYDGTIEIKRDAIIRECPDIPHGSTAAPNIYKGWDWKEDVIYITKPPIVESYNPVTGDSKSGIWIVFPVDGDKKYVALSPANADRVSALPGGEFVKGEFDQDGGFYSIGHGEYKPSELGVISVTPPDNDTAS
jgi:hypothetical protein